MSETKSMNNSEAQWNSVYILGGIATIIALIGIVLDVLFGSVTGGNLSALPQTAVDRFAQFQMNYPAASGRGIKDRNPARTFRRRAAGY